MSDPTTAPTKVPTTTHQQEKAGSPPEPDFDIGARIREIRKNKGLTASAVAAAAGVTSGAISQIESGQTLPSLTTLRKITAALNEPTFKLFLRAGDEPEQIVVRANERRVLSVRASSTAYELLTPNLRGELEVIEMRLTPGRASADVPLPHSGQECMVVLQGEARLELAGRTYDLGPGDSATYRGELPHRVVNIGTDEVIALSAITPPAF